MEVHGHNLHTPKAPTKKPQRHSLQPQIFLQLEFSSPTGKTIDASRIGVLNKGWHDALDAPNVCENYVTHVRVEHCEKHSSDLASELSCTHRSNDEYDDVMDVRLVGSLYGETKTESEEKSPDSPDSDFDGEGNKSWSSLSSVHRTKGMGRHDHLLEPLPNELFEVVPVTLPVHSDLVTTKSHNKVTTVVDTLSGSEIVDVRDCSLELFAMIERCDAANEVEATPKRSTRKGRRHSSSAIEIPDLRTADDALTPKRGRKKAACSEHVRSRSATNARRRHSTGRERKEMNTSSSHRKSSRASPTQYHRRRSEGSKDSETTNPNRPSSRKSISKDESEGKPSSHRERRKHHGRETNECLDVSRRRSAMI